VNGRTAALNKRVDRLCLDLLMQKTTLVLGASNRPEKYSYMAVQQLQSAGHKVIAVGVRPGKIGSVNIVQEIPPSALVHTVTLYLNANNQFSYIDILLKLKPVRMIFNPGAENPLLKEKANAVGIITLEACTLVMLRTSQY
jgi:predicted CoA-binding protein